MSDSLSTSNPVAALADEYVARTRRGERLRIAYSKDFSITAEVVSVFSDNFESGSLSQWNPIGQPPSPERAAQIGWPPTTCVAGSERGLVSDMAADQPVALARGSPELETQQRTRRDGRRATMEHLRYSVKAIVRVACEFIGRHS